MNQAFHLIVNNLAKYSAMKNIQYNVHEFHKRSNSARAINVLYSTIFFDDDDDINWDEDDDDDDLNFNVQYQGRAFDEDFKGSSDGTDSSSSRSVKSSAHGEMQQSAFDDIDDDTDDSYYDNLFKLQSGLTIDEKENNDDYDNELEEEEDFIQGDMSNNDKEYQTSQYEQHEDSLQQAEEYNESMSQIKKEFYEKRIKQIRHHQWERQLDRFEKKASQMEERAMFLALRALRQQSKMFTTMNLYHQSISSISLIEEPIKTESNKSTPTKALSESKEKNISLDSLLDKSIPSPTLSYSSTRNYKRQDDYPRENNKRKNNDDDDGDNDNEDANIIEIEKRLYGNRFKNAFGVYLRLLQVLDEIKFETKDQASEYLLDQMEQSFELAQAHSSDNIPSAVLSGAPTMSYTKIQNTIEMKKQNQERMKVIIALSLFRRHEVNTGLSSTIQMQNHQQQQQKVMKMIQEKYDLDEISIQDLVYILQIRGNVKRRGRIPRSRQKLIEQLTLSFWSDIFQS